MKVTDVNGVTGPERVRATDASTPPVLGPAAGPKDRVTVEATKAAEASVTVAQRAAGGHRAARLEQLESQVRSGGYAPDPSRVAEQILSDAEVDARIAAMLQR